MAARFTIYFVLAIFGLAYGKTEYEEYSKQLKLPYHHHHQMFNTSETFKEFVRLVEKYNLNVSLIVSEGKKFEEGNLKEIMTMTLTLPVNKESIHEATLTKSSFDKFADIATSELLTVATTCAKNNELKILTNHKKGIPISRAHKIFTGIKNGKTGFVFDQKNYVAQYTFLTLGEDGKNVTSKVLYGDVDIDVIEKSSNLTDDEAKIIKKALADAICIYDDEYLPKGLGSILTKALPEISWDVAGEVGDDSYVDSDKWALLKFLDYKYLVYAS